ncbi:unnamed protein product [Schistosoma spindalis]|nr:unnamed protein product [Schistosoma spindale]
MTLYDRVLNANIDLSNIHATSVSAFLLFYMIDYALQTCQSSNKTTRNTYLFIRLRNYTISIIHAFISGLSSLIWILVCYALFGLLMELNSIFLHARRLMILLNIDPESVTYRLNAVANINVIISFTYKGEV